MLVNDIQCQNNMPKFLPIRPVAVLRCEIFSQGTRLMAGLQYDVVVCAMLHQCNADIEFCIKYKLNHSAAPTTVSNYKPPSTLFNFLSCMFVVCCHFDASMPCTDISNTC